MDWCVGCCGWGVQDVQSPALTETNRGRADSAVDSRTRKPPAETSSPSSDHWALRCERGSAGSIMKVKFKSLVLVSVVLLTACGSAGNPSSIAGAAQSNPWRYYIDEPHTP